MQARFYSTCGQCKSATSGSVFGKSVAVLQRQLRDDFGRTGKTQPTGVERHVIEGWVVNLSVEVAPYVAASCLVLLPDQLGRFGFTQVVVFGGTPNSRRKRRHQPHVKYVREACGDDVASAPYQNGVA